MWEVIYAFIQLSWQPTTVENGHFLNLRWQNEQRSPIRQNKLNNTILKSIEQEPLCQGSQTQIAPWATWGSMR